MRLDELLQVRLCAILSLLAIIRRCGVTGILPELARKVLDGRVEGREDGGVGAEGGEQGFEIGGLAGERGESRERALGAEDVGEGDGGLDVRVVVDGWHDGELIGYALGRQGNKELGG